MKKEDKELLLKDLCARLPYKVKVYGNYRYNNGDRIVEDKKIEALDLSILDWFVNGIDIKPYLRPMSSMTEEEKLMYEGLMIGIDNISYMLDVIDWLNSHHFDYRGLIEKGLAIDATRLNIY